jgi:hypothetical protein
MTLQVLWCWFGGCGGGTTEILRFAQDDTFGGGWLRMTIRRGVWQFGGGWRQFRGVRTQLSGGLGWQFGGQVGAGDLEDVGEEAGSFEVHAVAG